MRKIFLLLLPLILGACVSTNTASAWNPFAAKDPSIEEISEDTQEVAEEFQDISKDYVMASIMQYNDMLTHMRKDVTGKKWFFVERTEKEQFEAYLGNLEDMKNFYNKLVEKKSDVEDEMSSGIRLVKDFEKSIAGKINKEYQNITALKKAIAKSGKLPADQRTALKKSKNLQIKFSQRRIELLRDFKKKYVKLRPQLQQAEKRVDKFIFLIVQSSEVYNSAYDTLKLQHDIQTAMNTMEDMAAEMDILNELNQGLEKSMDDINAIVMQLTDMAVGLKEEK
ncbi:MAG: hypothetical protein ACNI27_02925 [Desulfovibrio sp.]